MGNEVDLQSMPRTGRYGGLQEPDTTDHEAGQEEYEANCLCWWIIPALPGWLFMGMLIWIQHGKGEGAWGSTCSGPPCGCGLAC